MVQLLYAKYFNKKYGRKGQLFEGRYRPKVIKDQKYMMQLIRYLMENPVRAGLVKKPEDWEFLSFNAKLID
jgi:REP element-mobilizing transposase RayT